MKEEKLHKLISKVLTGQATKTEAAAVDVWYQSFESRAGFTEALNDAELNSAMQLSYAAVKEAIYKD